MPLTRTELQSLRSLAQKKHRHTQGRYLIEGGRLVGEAIRSGVQVERLLLTDKFTASTAGEQLAGETGGLEVTRLTATQAEQLSLTPHPQGVFAVLALPSPDRSPPQPLEPPILILDGIADPGNLGSILRTADWFAIPTVWVSADSADITNPKVVRGGMGAHFHLSHLWQGDLAAGADRLATEGVTLMGATLDGQPLDQVQPPGRSWALIVGSEVRGLNPFWRERLDLAVTIPGRGQAESLNVSVAVGVLLHYFLSSEG